MSMEGSVSRLSDLTPVPLKLTVKDDLCTIHLHHLMVTKDTTSQEFDWKDKPLRDRSKPFSTHQMSKALRLLLPYPVLCASKAERVFLLLRNIKSTVLSALPGLYHKDITFQTYLSGSKGENLDIPLTFSLDEELNIKSVSKSDLDLLIVVPMQPMEANRMVVDTEGTHSGYFRCLGKETMFACGVSEFVFQQSQLVGQVRGPSVLANTPMKQVDHVLAFQYHGWPEETEDFQLRKHPSGWPSEDMVKEIVHDGCHMVLKSHPFTDNNVRNEWRYSFSLAEKRLAASLTESQRFVFMYLKLLHHENFNCRDEITSYHVKTVMFWECEEFPPAEWTHDNEATRLLSLLDRLLRHLRERNLPSFFIPDNNLIDHIPTERIEHLQTVVADIRANLMTYIMKFLKQNRFLGYPLSLSDEEIEDIGRFAMRTETTESEADMVQAHVDLAVRCAVLHVADFYLCEKTVLDTTLYFMQPGEGTLAAHLIRCYLHNIMLPLRSALYILQQAWMESETGDRNTGWTESGSTSKPAGCPQTALMDKPTLSSVSETNDKIWECLTSLGDCVSAEGLAMADDKQTEMFIQQFLNHELPGLLSARQRLETLLQADTSKVDFDLCTSKLQTAWTVLLHLVAYCFIIVSSRVDCTAEKYLGRIQDLQLKLTQSAGMEDLSYCCQQLHAFSLFYLGCDKEVEEILLSSKLKPTAADWLRKLLSAKQESTSTKLSSSKWAWESVSLTTYDTKLKEDGLDFIADWLEHQPYSNEDFSCVTSFPAKPTTLNSDSHPVGRLYGMHDRTYWDSCMMRWEVDTAQNLLVPKENLLRQSLQSMVEDLLTADQGAGTALDAMHPSCTLIVAKYLLLNKDTDKAITLLEPILEDPRSVIDCYRIFPLEVRLMLDDRVLAGTNLRIQDHFDFSIIMYALYLLFRAHLEKGELCAAQMKVDEMTQLCEKDQSGQLGCSYSWQVSANNLTLLGTAQNMCGNKAGSLMAFLYAELVSRGQTPLMQGPQSLKMDVGTNTQVVMHGINVLSRQLNISSAAAFRICLDVLYPDTGFNEALERLVVYCTDGGVLHKEYRCMYEIMSDLTDHRLQKYRRKMSGEV